jgi:hypothetical protein
MEKVRAGALLDQTLQKLIYLHLQKYEQQLEEVQKELEPFEKGMYDDTLSYYSSTFGGRGYGIW